VRSFAQARDVERSESRELQHLDHAHRAARRDLFGLDLRTALDDVALRRLSGDRSLHRDLARDHVFPLELEAGRVDERDARFRRQREHALLERDAFALAAAKIDGQRLHARLDQPIDDSRRPPKRHVDRRGKLGHELARRFVRRTEEREAHRDRS
jgi:hypothetical protein